MFGGMNPKKMQAVMKKMGIAQTEIPAERVIIEKSDGNKIIISNPSVLKISMNNQESFQISGETSEEEEQTQTSEEDIKTIIEKTGATKEQAEKALENANGDLAEAILELSE